MKTIGAKGKEDKFKECERVRRDLALNRSDYVRKALDLFNHVHFFRKLTEEGYPVLKAREPEDAGRTEGEEGYSSSDIDKISRKGRETGDGAE